MTKSSSSGRRGGNTRDLENDDAITILNAVIEFRSKHGGSPPTPTTMKPVFDAVKDSLRQKITIDQLYNKFRTLKQNYYKAVNAGVGPTPFDRRFFDLSVKAWGDKRPREEEDTKKGIKKVKNEANGIKKVKNEANGSVDEDTKNNKKTIKKVKSEANGSVDAEDSKNNKMSGKKMKVEADDSVSADADDDGDASDEEEEEEEEDGGDSFRFLTERAKKYWEMHGMPMSSLELGLKFMDRAKATLLEKKWRQHSFAEMKAEAKDFEWKKDVRVSVVAAAMKNTRIS